ncbi:diguanylate cyclase [Paenibacillus sp. HN-1]|uniref:histidine kinase N-terminal 7TM domain-containing diguanylate cyclase n=1 Tax=Paenibacillus TaxID=44249 RepID=UPI001CAA17FA|nr:MULTISPECIES: diguanylate cyclase [Paenibacillus]MBY9079938.1 diguanylate cyclase [Paenibacillus sp. CGMCC 1.18879]MBY9084579.1 diguanylate cyclase [Paenibacillus sinensis]
MGLEAWIDLLLFFILFALFIYIFVTVTITKLHKVYLTFHFAMMIWPYCQFVIKTIDNPGYQLLYVKLAFVDSAVLTTGWLYFTILITGQIRFLRRKIWAWLFIPTIIALLGIIVNPHGLFVLPWNGGYVERIYGPIFWFYMCILVSYPIASLYMIYLALASGRTPRKKQQITLMLKGLIAVTGFLMLDILLNVVLSDYLPVIPGMTSLGILISAIFFVISINREKVLDIVTIAHQDIIDTMAYGILVLDDNETVVEINQALRPYMNLQIGDRFNIAANLPQEADNLKEFLHSYYEHPLKDCEIDIHSPKHRKYLHVHAAAIMVSDEMVGRIITFQDISELRRLLNETSHQNLILQERNESLIEVQKELYQTNRKLKKIAITDSLTGCYNRHYLTQKLEGELMKSGFYQDPFAIILLDIDFFKSVNDNYGHLAGDEVICHTVEAVKRTLREADILARYGGEEFIIYLPNTDESLARFLAEEVKSNVESNAVLIEHAPHPISITISMGLLSIREYPFEPPQDPKILLNDLFKTVDEALYQAKNEGRNRIVSLAK